MGFCKQEYWSGLPFPSPEDLPDPGIEPGSPVLQADTLPFELVTGKTLRVDKYPDRLRSEMSPGISYLEMQIKTINTVRYHLTHVTMPSSKNLQTINAGEKAEKGCLLHCWLKCKLV